MGGKLSQYLLVSLLALIPAVAVAQNNKNVTFSFATPVVLASTETPGDWYPDRHTPCGFSSPATAPNGTKNTLEESICTSDWVTPTDSFYNTQGRKYDLVPNTYSITIDLYVPSSWGTLNGRAAGFWATAVNSTNVIGNDYPIIEFQGPTASDAGGPSYQPNGGVAGFYGWNNVTSAFDPIGLPANFHYNTWVTLTMTAVPGTGFLYTVHNASDKHGVSMVSPFYDPTEASLGNVILQGYNYDSNYSIFWNDLTMASPALECVEPKRPTSSHRRGDPDGNHRY